MAMVWERWAERKGEGLLYRCNKVSEKGISAYQAFLRL